MKLAWTVAILLLALGVAIFIEALVSTRGVAFSLLLLFLSGLFTGPALLALLGLVGLYDLAVEINGHRLEFRKLAE